VDYEQLVAGTVIAERYVLECEIGRGAMGTVWRAEHVSLQEPVAIKLINTSLLELGDARSRFMREARAAARLRSTHVVQILDHGVDQDIPFIVMELLRGESLGTRLQRRGALSIRECTRVVEQVGRALTLAHEHGIVHRDLKPDNIFLSKEGEHEVVKVLDFGIAKDTRPSLTATLETQEGAILGTPYYLSPEQAQGSLSVDHRSDLWALSVIAFECITGRRAFESNHVGDLIVRICSRPIPKPSSVTTVPDGFDEWFLKGVERDPDARFQSCAELVNGLTRVSSTHLALERRDESQPLSVGNAETLREDSDRTPKIDDERERSDRAESNDRLESNNRAKSDSTSKPDSADSDTGMQTSAVTGATPMHKPPIRILVAVAVAGLGAALVFATAQQEPKSEATSAEPGSSPVNSVTLPQPRTALETDPALTISPQTPASNEQLAAAPGSSKPEGAPSLPLPSGSSPTKPASPSTTSKLLTQPASKTAVQKSLALQTSTSEPQPPPTPPAPEPSTTGKPRVDFGF
jgi:serine/threonine-protein kinase